MRKQFIAIAAGAALGLATMVTAAVAAEHGGGRGGGGGGGHANFSGGGGGGRAAFGGGSGGGGRSFAAPRANGMNSNFGGARGNFAANNRAVVPNASKGMRGNGMRSNFAANNWHNGRHDHGYRRGFVYGGGIYALGGYGPAYYDYSEPDYTYDDSDGCYQRQLVQTSYGAQWQLVDVCQYQ